MRALGASLAMGLALLLVACDDEDEVRDAGTDAALIDAAFPADARVLPDGGDAAPARMDARVVDAARVDATTPDAAAADAGIPRVGVLYAEDFESGAAGWRGGGRSSSWALGAPAGATISSAFSGTSAWVTNLTGNHNDSEDSFAQSPPIDLSRASGAVVVRVAVQYVTDPCCDDAWLEVSTDRGETWARVGARGQGMGWYSNPRQVWTGSSRGWQIAQIAVPDIAGRSDVRFRFRFTSDATRADEGFAFDAFEVLEQIDLALTLTGLPEGCGTRIVVANVGSVAVESFDLSIVADGITTTEHITVPLAPGEVHGQSVEAASVRVRVSAPGDVDVRNDEDQRDGIVPLGAGYSESFEGGRAGWFASGSVGAWAHGMPAGTFIPAAASGTRAWVTNLSGPHPHDALGYLVSPCFDLGAAGSDPTIAFAHIFEADACCDGSWLELSTDGGATWAKLGDGTGGTAWYGDGATQWWSGTSGAPGAWRTASHPLAGAAGSRRARVRFVLSTDATVALEGFGVDDVTLTP